MGEIDRYRLIYNEKRERLTERERETEREKEEGLRWERNSERY